MVSCALAYDVLLRYTDGETARWHDWFSAHPTALDVPFATGSMDTLRGLLVHIFAVELRYAERLLGRPVTSYDDIQAKSIEEIFALGDRARALLREYLDSATMDDMREVLTFATLTAGTVTASKYKIASNVFLHGIRHWGQVATVLRTAGFGDQWGHDMLLSDVELTTPI